MSNVQLSAVAPAASAGANIAGSGSVPPVAPAAQSPDLANGEAAGGAVIGLEAVPATAPAGVPLLPDAPVKAANAAEHDVKKAVKDANAALAANGTQLVFVFDDQTHHFAVKLLDIQTQKVVQEIPPAAMHATASALAGPPGSGALVDTKA
jgi:uncharacterized FlaG/YvyC family protein